jgi:very-short-patch-repair endonuclease
MSHRDSNYSCKMCFGFLEKSKSNLCVECKTKMLEEKWLCHCGCGELINRWNLSHYGNIREVKFKLDHMCSRYTNSGIHKCPCCIRTFSDLKSYYRHIDLNRCIDKGKMEEYKKNWNQLCHCGCGNKILPGRKGLPGHMESDPWNKGLTKEDDERLMTYSKRRIEEIKNGEGVQMSNTSIEIKVKEYLKILGVKFIHQYHFFHKHLVDFCIPGYKLIIECDGDYWHTKDQKVIDKDIEENKFIEEKGWKILRLWESDINIDFEECKKKIMDCIFNRK